ncbi:cation-translocating P-type ATPase [Chitinophaga tropicalis]|uniref:HAD-IC family P-type ATPase n=1 Tax=Chitinophaga tropicalis TaxID=2683588 RepID=A0A7K1U311_9BACT|nr:cation-translocating P-type ATPase [Chitinophaga tropicalis]MVT08731.1 HAD-IC family P-type ATPase [Chitinophaga tropicalis]
MYLTMATTPVKTKYRGLALADIVPRQKQYGKNVLKAGQPNRLPGILINIVREPMFLLLLAACVLYFLLNSFTEGFMMLMAILLVTAISVYQENRSSRALEALKQYSAPLCTVIRENKEMTIPAADLVPEDILLLHEGEIVPADVILLEANDLTVNESLLTGEAFPAGKEADGKTMLYQGTTLNSGACVSRVMTTGNATLLGKMGKSIQEPDLGSTLLQRQMKVLVRRLAIFGITGFIFVCGINFLRSGDITGSLLLGLTLAMAAIPEEIPVAFSSFMALGGLYMSRMGIIPKQSRIIEYLGAASVLCLDKTGTITENKMQVADLYDVHRGILPTGIAAPAAGNHLLYFAALACERSPFDSMEVAITEAFLHSGGSDNMLPPMIHEYPLEGRPPMMTHVYRRDNNIVAAAKGAPERILRACRSDAQTVAASMAFVNKMAKKGHRVLGIASAILKDDNFPFCQDDLNWQLEGMVALYDPPRKEAAPMISALSRAGLRVNIITGDYPVTALYIAGKTGITHKGHCVTGEQVMSMSDTDLKDLVKHESVYARMFPEAKLKVIEALKANNEIVAMTGDGVNDGPALKAAHIGIAMGKKGTEIARIAADLVITDDNLSKIPAAVEQGRKIYNNLKKAVRYIISIHIPIILTTAIPLVFSWKYPNIFTPVHVIFLELIMGPTCSLFYEKEPAGPRIMYAPPRSSSAPLLTGKELLVSIIQGLAITAGVLTIYASSMQQGNLEETRTLVFLTLLYSNIFLTFANRSFTEPFELTIKYRNRLSPAVITVSVLFIAAIYLVPSIRNVFGMTTVAGIQFFICAVIAFCSVAWFEVFKYFRYRK